MHSPNLKHSFYLLMLITISPFITNAQIDTTIAWDKVLGGSYDSHNSDIKPTADGGYIVAGATTANDGDVSGNHGESDAWVLKLDAAGNIVWQKCLGGSRNDAAKAIQQTGDGGYIMAGSTASTDGDVSGNHNNTPDSTDVWMVKLTASGTIEWQKCFGGSGNDVAHSIQVTPDNGYVFTAGTNSIDGDVGNAHADTSYWFVKINSTGDIQWKKCFDGAAFSSNHFYYGGLEGPYYSFSYGYPNGSFIQNTADKGFIIAAQGGATVAGNHGGLDYLVLKLDSTGNTQWQKSLGDSLDDVATCIQPLAKGGYIVIGNSVLTNTSHHFSNGTYLQVPLLIRLDALGNVQWQKLDSLKLQNSVLVSITANALAVTADGDYLMAGYASAAVGFTFPAFGWLARLDSAGNTKGISYPQGFLYAFSPVSNGGFIASGDIYPQSFVDSTFVARMYIVKFKESLLPVALLNFTASPQKNDVLTQWQTATEINTNRFNVQRSFNALHFTTVGSLNAAGNSSTVKEYTYTDDVTALLGSYSTIYYRLQEVDKDGGVTYSKTARVIFPAKNISLMVSPNPVKNQLTVRVNNYSGNITLVVYDMGGRRLRQVSQLASNTNGITINTSALAKGGYIVTTTVNGVRLEEKFIKQ